MAEIFLSSIYDSLRHSKDAIIYLTPAICVNIMRILFIYLFIPPSHDFQHKVSEWVNVWKNERTNEEGEGTNEWISERTNERLSEEVRECLIDWVSEWIYRRI